MKEIRLANNRGVALVDDDDYDLVARGKWFLFKNAYAKGRMPGQRTLYRMHRLIMGVQGGIEVDHINRNGLDNRRENLRLCSRSENSIHRRKLAGTSSRFRGVTRRSWGWEAKAGLNNKKVYLGTFADEIDAARAYDAFVRDHFGEFAILNEVD